MSMPDRRFWELIDSLQTSDESDNRRPSVYSSRSKLRYLRDFRNSSRSAMS